MTPLTPDDPRHGTAGGYRNHKCRCEACRAAHSEQQTAYMRARRQRQESVREHGTRVGYNCGCRCDECRQAHNAYSREYKRRRRAAAVERKAEGQ